MEQLAEQLAGTTLKFENSNSDVANYLKNDFTSEVNQMLDAINSSISDSSSDMETRIENVVNGFSNIENSINSLSTTTTSSLSATLARILENFVALKSLINNLNEKTSNDINQAVEEITTRFSELSDKVEAVDSNIDEDLTRQLSIIEHNFETLANVIADLFARGDARLGVRIDTGFANIAGKMESTVAEQLEQYKTRIEELFDDITLKNNDQATFIQERVFGLNAALQEAINKQNNVSAKYCSYSVSFI